MILPDVNVVLYAFRSDTQNHNVVRAWLDLVINGDAIYGMSPQVLASVLRLATNPRIFSRPSQTNDVLQFASMLLDQSHCQIIQPGSRHWSIFRNLCQDANAKGNLVQDAWFAALAIESGCEWITTDRDFARFPGLRWRTPL